MKKSKITVEFEPPMYGGNYSENQWLCTFILEDKSYFCANGENRQISFENTMQLLRVQIMLDNNIQH